MACRSAPPLLPSNDPRLLTPPSLTCRQRKLKCDETKPICGQCKKGSRECRPSDGVVFRHQQNASMNGNEEVEDGNGQKLGGFFAYKNTFNEDNIWVEVPKKGSQIEDRILFSKSHGLINLQSRSIMSLILTTWRPPQSPTVKRPRHL